MSLSWLWQIAVDQNPCQRYELYFDVQRWDSNSWCDHHMIGDVLCNYLLVSHLVVTFCVGDHHDSHRRYAVLASGSKNKMSSFSLSVWLDWQSKKTDWERMLMLLHETTRQLYSKNVVIITDRKCREQSEWQRFGCQTKSHQACVWSTNCLSLTSDHLGMVRELRSACQSEFRVWLKHSHVVFGHV